MKTTHINKHKNVYTFILFIALIAPSFYIYTNCAVADKVADIWESDPLSSRHRDIALKVLRKYRKLYVDIFPYFVQNTKNTIFLGRAGNTTYDNHHYTQVLDCIDDAIDAYNEERGSANLYYFNDDERIFGIDNDEGATAVASGNAIFIPESFYELAIDSFVDEPYVVEDSFALFQILVHEFNHWNGISHQNEMHATHPDFIDFTTKKRSKQLDLFYQYSDSTYYFESGMFKTISEILNPYSFGYIFQGTDYKNFKCSGACNKATVARYDESYPTTWDGETELDWYGISESEYSSLVDNLCGVILIDSSAATDPMNVCSRESSIKDEILAYHASLCSCAEIDELLLSQVRNLDISNKSVSSLTRDDFFGIGENLFLNADNNSLTSIASELFAHVPTTMSISFKKNQISSVSYDAFSNLNQLYLLDLSNNLITSLTNTQLFKDLSGLKNLNLNDNKISSIGTSMFSNLVSLERINLSNNQLTSLPSDFFDMCAVATNLQNINLNGNNFSSDTITSYQALAASKCPSVSVGF